ncbi:TetR/AcrR family transcriptional regulator C-terminal domain-containing protein [Nonomuraea sp. NPDC003804]|uniref:TetR/AcrR family transcriptional regulator n=1 Tax=Nonomuraea sp. NPDC003804 TaxID=3154547 RepID=UPI0033A5DDD5
MAKRAERPGDPIKLIGLLWRPAEAVSRSGLTPKRITDAAIAVADQEGLDALTIRRVAGDLGVSPMALYPYIAGRSELIELMLDAVAAEVYAEGAPPAQAGPWRARAERIAQANWDHHMAHPWTVEAAPGRPVPGPGVSGKYEAELSALDGLGLSDIEMDRALTAILGLVSSAARWVISLRRIREESALTDVQWWEGVAPALAAATAGTAYPVARRVSTSLGEATGMASDPEGAFRFGLDMLLDGLARQIDARP